MNLVDAELLSNSENEADYGIMGETSLERIWGIRLKLYNAESSIRRGLELSEVSKTIQDKFILIVEELFDSLPKVLKWKSFYRNAPPVLQLNSPAILHG